MAFLAVGLTVRFALTEPVLWSYNTYHIAFT